jgi:3-isopropylmalate/(R)-2-methylmalate dehydratase small subunit
MNLAFAELEIFLSNGQRTMTARARHGLACKQTGRPEGRAAIARHSRVSYRPPVASADPVTAKTMEDVSMVGKKRDGDLISGKVFVVRDNIDTDQIIPAEYLTLVPSKPDEYLKLGSYAFVGLPDDIYPTRFVAKDSMRTEYPIIIAGENFGCGSSREHAPIAIGACGGCAVIAQSYARIFFRNCSATGELYPWESVDRLVDHFETGQTATIDFEHNRVTNVETGATFELRPLGEVLPVVDAGGIFQFARKSGMIGSRGSQN